MARPASWIWGLAPLALLWGAGNVHLGDAIERDVAAKAVAAAIRSAGEAPGARAITAQVAGRDVLISGDALSADGAARAVAQLRSEFGVRRVLGGLSQAQARKPYSWSASHGAGGAVVLEGFVPDEATARANRAAVSEVLPQARIDDRQSLAYGAPSGFAAMTKAVIGQLPRLSSGKVALDDMRFCIEGKAGTPRDFEALKAALPGADGFQPVDCTLEPPTVQPYLWSATRSAAGNVSVEGYAPGPEVRAEIAALLRRQFPEPATIEDRTLPALGAPSAFLFKVGRAIADLARLRSGRVELRDGAYALSGEGPADFDACQALRLLVAQTDGPDSVAQATIACPPPPVPVALPALPPLPDIPPLFIAPREAQGAAPAATPADAPVVSVPALPEIPPPAFAEAPPVVAPAPEIVVEIAPPVLPPPPPPPAPPAPLRWRAEIDAGRLVISGLVRDEATRLALQAAARRSAPGRAIEDGLTLAPNLREAPDFGEATGFLLGLLGQMSRGVATIEGLEARLAGAVASEETWRALQAALAQRPLPGGLTAGARSSAEIGVRPFELSASVDRSELAMSGFLPDVATREAIAALIGRADRVRAFRDATRIVPGAPAGFGAAARAAVADLLRLDLGAARLDAASVTVQGLTCRDLIKSEVETSLGSGLPPGFSGTAQISLRQAGCVIDPPNTCQNDLDALTQRNMVLFAQGTTVVTLDQTTERAISEAFAILRQCPASKVTIEGHANLDGERTGFDNRDLSRRRALRVRDELLRRGLDPGQLDIRGFGVERPLVPHGDPQARVRNRRVQFTVAK